jgi:hypothetical protein
MSVGPYVCLINSEAGQMDRLVTGVDNVLRTAFNPV